jgi:hypothetical protein
MNTREQLTACDLADLEPGEFRETVWECFRSQFPTVTVDELLLRPTECALPLCRHVRDRLKCKKLPERLILAQLLQGRKRPDMLQ